MLQQCYNNDQQVIIVVIPHLPAGILSGKHKLIIELVLILYLLLTSSMKTLLDLFYIQRQQKQPTTFIELCAGTASLSVALMGLDGLHQPPYLGSKYRHAGNILGIMDVGHCQSYHWNDIGHYGIVWQALTDPILRASVINQLEEIKDITSNNQTDKSLAYYETLVDQPVPTDIATYTAIYIYLANTSYRGKPVYIKDGKWKRHTFNYRVTSKNTPISTHIDRIKKLSILDQYNVTVTRQSAEDINPIPGSICYIDPPYQGTTRYTDSDLKREAVINIALKWKEAGASVYISEKVPIDIPGWTHIDITDLHTRGGAQNLSLKPREEWITYYEI